MNRLAILEELNISVANREEDILYVNKLKSTEDKVKYLRIIRGYKQIEVSEIIGISLRQVQRVEKKIKEN